MTLYWLCYRHNNQISVVIEPGASPTSPKDCHEQSYEHGRTGEYGPIHMAACGAASRDYVFDGPEL